VLAAGAPALADVCAEIGATQFADAMRYCTTSVLSSQGRNDYMPDTLFDGDPRTAWCEGVAGLGAGETIMIDMVGAPAFRRLLVANGYAKSQTAYVENARPRVVEVTTSASHAFRAQLADTPEVQYINLPGPALISWVRIAIRDVYTGSKYADTCLNAIGPDLEYEEFLLQQSQ